MAEMQGGMSYVVSVKLEELKSLELLRNTIQEIQALSNTGATFNMRINSQLTGNVQTDVASAVAKGMKQAESTVKPARKGAIPGTGSSADMAGAGAQMNTLLTAITQLVNALGAGGGGGGEAEQQKGPAAELVRELASLRRAFGLFDSTAKTVTAALGTAEKVSRSRKKGAGFATEPEFNETELEQIVPALPPRRRSKINQLKENKAKLEEAHKQGLVTTEEYDEALYEHYEQLRKLTKPETIARLLQARRDRIKKSLEEFVAQETRLKAEELKTMPRGPSGTGSGGFKRAFQQSDTAGGKEPSLEAFKKAVEAGVVAGMKQWGGSRPAREGGSGGQDFVRRTVPGNEEISDAVLGFGPSPVDAAGNTVRRLRRELSGLQTRLDRSKAGSKEAIALQALVSDVAENLQLAENAKAAAAAIPNQQGFAPGMTAQALAEAQAQARAQPGSVRTAAFVRGNRALGTLDPLEQMFVRAAAADRVVGVTGIFDQVDLQPKQQSLYNNLLGREKAREEQLARKKEELAREGDPRRAANLRVSMEDDAAAIEKLQLERAALVNLSGNALVDAGTKAYANKLARDPSDEARREAQALRQSITRVEQVAGPGDPLREHLTLLPEALAHYVKRTMERYVSEVQASAEGKASPELQKEIDANPLLKAIAGQNSIQDVRDTTVAFGDQLAIYRQLAPRGAASFTPPADLDAAQLQEFKNRALTQGASFAPSTVEGHAFAVQELERYSQLASNTPGTDPAREGIDKRKRELETEILLGGKLFAADAIGHDPSSNVLYGRAMSPEEKTRVLRGGTRSDDYAAAAATTAAAPGTVLNGQSFARMTIEIEKMAKALTRLESVTKSLSGGGFDKIAATFQSMAAAIGPLAAGIEKLTGGGAASQRGTASAVARGLGQRLVEDAKLAGRAARKEQDRDEDARDQALRAARRAVAEREAGQELGERLASRQPSLPPPPLSREERFADLLRTRKQLIQSQRQQEERVDLLMEQKARGINVAPGVRALAAEDTDYVATQGRFARRLLDYNAIDPRLFGPKVRDAAQEYLDQQEKSRVIGSSATNLRDLVVQKKSLDIEKEAAKKTVEDRAAYEVLEKAKRDRLNKVNTEVSAYTKTITAETEANEKLGRARERANKLKEALAKTPEPTPTEVARVELAKDDVKKMAERANIARANANAAREGAASRVGLRFEEDSGTGKFFDLKTGLPQLERAVQTRLEADAEEARVDYDSTKRSGPTKRGAELAAEKLAAAEAELKKNRAAIAKERKTLEAATGEKVIASEKELNKLLREQTELLKARGNALQQSTEAEFKRVANASTFFKDFKDKVSNLTQYVGAGAIVYSVAAQLRSAMETAIGTEADLTRIQGVIEGRSAQTRNVVGAGIYSAATEFGTPLQTSVQAAKLFAQTGASGPRTIELTRASLAAQVGAGLEAGQATELLIATDNITNGRVGSFDLLDRISRIESQYAVSAQDLAQAIQRAGSIAEQMQPKALGSIDALDTVIGSATAIIERTRVSGNQAATSLRFIFSRLSSPEVANKLQNNFGIALAGKSPTELRPLQDILSDISDKYKSLTDSSSPEYNTVKAQQLLVAFGGARQVNATAALLENFGYVMKVATESSLAYGDTQARVNLQLQTTQTAFTQFQSALSGFALRVLTQGGGGWVTRGALNLGTGYLNATNSVGGGLLVGGATVAAGYAANMGAARIRAALDNPFAGPLLTRAAPTLGVAATGLGALGTAGFGLGITAVALALGEATVAFSRFVKDIDRFSSVTKFDREGFEKTDFFKNFEATGLGFGSQADAYSRRIADATRKAQDATQAELGPESLKPGYRNENFAAVAERQLRAAFREEFPQLSLESDATVTAFALEQVKQQYRFEGAPVTQAREELTAKTQDLFANFEKSLKGYVGNGYQSGIDNLFYQGMFRGSPLANRELDALGFRGQSGQTVRITNGEKGPEGLTARAEFFKENILVSSENQLRADRIRAVRAEIEASGQVATSALVTAKLQEKFASEYGQLAPEALAELNDVIRRVENTDRAGKLIAERAYSFISGPETAEGLSAEQILQGRPGAIVEEGYKQIFASARTQLLELAKQNTTTAQRQRTATFLETLSYAYSRPKQLADIDNKNRSQFLARERLTEPFIQYGLREQGIQTSLLLNRTLGVGVDETGLRAESGIALVRDVANIRGNILGDLARTSGRLAFTLNPTAAQDAVDNETDAEKKAAATKDVTASALLNAAGVEEYTASAIRQIDSYKEQLRVLDEGLSDYASSLLADPTVSEDRKTGVNNLMFALTELLDSSRTLKAGDLVGLFRESRNFEAFKVALATAVQPDVTAERRQLARVRNTGYTGQERIATAQADFATLEQRLGFEAQLAAITTDPKAEIALALQNRDQIDAAALNIAEVTKRAALANANAARTKSGETAYQAAIAEAQNTFTVTMAKLRADSVLYRRNLTNQETLRVKAAEQEGRQIAADAALGIRAGRRAAASALLTQRVGFAAQFDAIRGTPGQQLFGAVRDSSTLEQRRRSDAAAELADALAEVTRKQGEGLDFAIATNQQNDAKYKYAQALEDIGAEGSRERESLFEQERLRVSTERRGEAQSLYDSTITSPLSGLLQSSENFKRSGYEQAVGGVAAGFQTRLVEKLTTTLSNSGIGQTIIGSFETGALYTKESIIAGFMAGNAIVTGVNSALGPSKLPGLDANGLFTGTSAIAGLSPDQVIYDEEQGIFGSIANANIVGKRKGLGRGGRAVLDAALPVIGSLAGGSIGPPGTFSNEGSSIGAAIGAATPLGAVGGLIGGLAGGLIGSFIKKKVDEPIKTLSPLERIERNTREAVQAIENQTKLMELDSRFLNIPAGFTLPGFTPFGATGGSAPVVNAQISIYTQPNQSAEHIAQQVVRQIGQELGIAGGSLDIRS